jgi:hypothetical protein
MAYEFTAANLRHLSVADTAALDITGSITLSAFVKSSGSFASNRGVIAKYQNNPTLNQRSYNIFVNNTGLPSFVISSSGTFESANLIAGTNSIGTNWTNLCATFNPSTRQELFLNGVSEALKTSSVAASIFSGSAPLWIGAQNDIVTANAHWDGLIAEVGIWNVVLTAAEIASLAKGMTCDKIRPQSLVFYAPLVRDLIDAKGGLTITNNNGATVANHPRIYP